MGKHRLPIFDGDGHVLEIDDELAQYYEGKYEGLRIFSTFGIWPSLDGWARGFILDTEDKSRKYTHTNAEIWGEMLDIIGAEGSVLYPTAGLACGLISDVEWARATAVAYNNWLEDRYTKKDDRLYGVGMLAVQDPEAAAAELRRCKNERVRFPACLLPSQTYLGKTLGDEFFWPIYEEAERQNMPLAIHGAPSRGLGFDHFTEFARVHALEHPFPLFINLTDIIFSGVYDEFPNLRIAFLEGGCSWVPFMMDRLDYEYDSVFGTKVRARLKKRPSDYMREGENFWVGVELGEKGLKYAVDAMGGSDRILYASDYPHEPTAEDLTADVPDFLDDDDYDDTVKANVLYNNTKNFYRLI
ncbi:MAG: amidohydrolase family protein [Pseudomonadota bacterium]|nr:amidohydrolase family protein [Pseudomonadota bacterium]